MSQPRSGDTSPSYAGDLSAEQAWKKLADDPQALLVDVRSEAEWTFVGMPNLAQLGKQPLFIQWQVFPGMIANQGFVADVLSKAPDKGRPLLLLCRSGGRSKSAAIALTAQGYAHCYNIAGGFEGDLDAEGHRGRQAGWKAAGLPWRQR